MAQQLPEVRATNIPLGTFIPHKPIRSKYLAAGGYALYSASGEFLGNAVQVLPMTDITSAGLSMLAGQGLYLQPAVTLLAAETMAHLEQLLGACTAADRDYERGGAVSAETIGAIRTLLLKRSAA